MPDLVPYALHGARMYLVELSRYLVAAGGLSLLLWLSARWTAARRIQKRQASFADRRRELVNSLVTIVTFAGSAIFVFAMVRAGVFHISFALPVWWVAVLEFVGIVIAHDAYFYWMHRGLHTRAMFRRAHATHHESRTPTPWAAYSFAPIEAFFEAAFVPLAIFLAPIHAVILLAFLIHQIGRNVLGHAGFELMPPGFTRSPVTGWLTTTTHHDLHHSQGRYNFGLYFTWWDRWMGTEHPLYHDAFETAALPWLRRRQAAEA